MNNTLKLTIRDLVTAFLVDDRKEDSELPIGEIERMIDDGDISVHEIAKYFEECLRKEVEP